MTNEDEAYLDVSPCVVVLPRSAPSFSQNDTVVDGILGPVFPQVLVRDLLYGNPARL